MKTNSFEAKNDKLICFGDVHCGGLSTDLNAFDKMIKYAEKSGAHLLGLGDWAEAISATDKRFDLGSIDPRFLDGDLIANQYNYIEEALEPIKDQVLTLHAGNHDLKVKKNCHIDMTKQMCRNLGIQYAEGSALTRLSFKRPNRTTSFVIYSAHGSQAGRNTGSKINSMESLSNAYVFDLAVCGHSHSLFTISSTQVYLSQNNTLGFRTIHFGNSGSFLRGIKENVVSYGELGGYKPSKVGYLLYKFDPEHHKITGKEVIL